MPSQPVPGRRRRPGASGSSRSRAGERLGPAATEHRDRERVDGDVASTRYQRPASTGAVPERAPPRSAATTNRPSSTPTAATDRCRRRRAAPTPSAFVAAASPSRGAGARRAGPVTRRGRSRPTSRAAAAARPAPPPPAGGCRPAARRTRARSGWGRRRGCAPRRAGRPRDVARGEQGDARRRAPTAVRSSRRWSCPGRPPSPHATMIPRTSCAAGHRVPHERRQPRLCHGVSRGQGRAGFGLVARSAMGSGQDVTRRQLGRVRRVRRGVWSVSQAHSLGCSCLSFQRRVARVGRGR